MYNILLLVTLIGGTVADHGSSHQEEIPPACLVSPDTSDCGGNEQRWFYYDDLKMCTEFTYKGCGKSENNFATREDCEKLCLQKTATQTTDNSATSKPIDQSESSTEVKVDEQKNMEKPAEKREVQPAGADGENPDADDVEGTDEDEEELQEKLREQEQIQQRFNMADSEDLLALEEYMQDDNIELADILDAAEAGEITEEDIRANLYSESDDDAYEYENEDYDTSDNVEEYETQQSEETNAEEAGSVDSSNENEAVTEEDTVETREDEDQHDTGEKESDDDTYLQQQIEEEAELQERFNMASDDDMIALQQIVQEPGMEVENIQKQEKDQDQSQEVSSSSDNRIINLVEIDIEDNTNELPDITIDIDDSVLNGQPEQNQRDLYFDDVINDDKDEDMEEIKQTRQQFSMADNEDYVTFADLMANPNMDIMEGETSETSNDEKEKHKGNMETVQEVPKNEDMYGEHLDYNPQETSKDPEEDEIDETLNFETELEQKFNMADRQDILSLEQILQDPNTDIGEVSPSDDSTESQDGDLKGVFSLAASFLGDNSSEEKDHLEELQNDMGHLPEIARKPFQEASEEMERDFNDVSGSSDDKQEVDYTHPAELLKEQQIKEDKELSPSPINIQSMAHDDKMMLMSLLHVDRLKFHRVEQTTPSLLDLVKEEREKKLQNQVSSPNEEFINMISKKDGVNKYCLYHKDPGPCQDKTLQWHYDPVLKTCLPFFYGGCEGNDNRFDTIGECLRKCGFNGDEEDNSSPEPIPEPPSFPKEHASPKSFKAVISKLLPGKIMSLRDRMSPGQQKFIHKFIKSALGHVSDIKPVKIAHIPLGFRKYKINENMVDKRNRLPMPIKSILFKWPILRMVFDRTIKDIKPMADMEDVPEPMGNLLPIFPKEFRRFEKDWSKKSGRGERKDFRKMSRDGNEFRKYKKFDRTNREEFGELKKMGRPWGVDREEKNERRSRHFSPSFKKSYKMMNHNEDKRHQISSDPKNKVNLIQVFVNKPHTESHSNPSHHHTMIKKEYSPVMEPKVDSPRPPAPAPPPPPQSYRSYPPHAPHHPPHQFYGRPHHPQPSSRPRLPVHSLPYPPKPLLPQNYPHGFPHPPPLNPPHPHQHVHMHEHIHPLPMVSSGFGHHHHHPPPPPPPFIQSMRPWWARFGKPYFEPPMKYETMRSGERTEEFNEEESEEEAAPEEREDTEEVLVVDGADQDEGPHYSCLLPVSTGVCKAFEERYYYNKATGTCELFIYGGCGGNANNYVSKKECEATCKGKPAEDTESLETSTLPDDTIVITSPVYVPAEAQSTVQEETTESAGKSEEEEGGKRGKGLTEAGTEEQEQEDDQPGVKVEPMKLFKSSNTEYIIIISVMCFVGLSAVVLVALAIANLSRRLSKTKKEKVIEAVLSSHLDARSSGTITPSRMSYYGHPPSEHGPPPISEVLKVHKDKADEEM